MVPLMEGSSRVRLLGTESRMVAVMGCQGSRMSKCRLAIKSLMKKF